MHRMLFSGLFFAFIALLLALGSCFVVRQTETALVTQFGNPVNSITVPGLNFKIPFIQTVEYFDKRLLEYAMSDEIEINASDEKRIRLAAFVRWRIIDPLAFVRATRSAGIGGNRIYTMNQQLGSLLSSSLGQAIGKVPMNALLSPERDNVMKEIRELMTKQAQSTGTSSEEDAKARGSAKTVYGIEIVDVRIVKADLPAENSKAIFQRMQTEREREAKSYRAKGAEEAQRIRAATDRERTVILAEARKKAEITRGEGDATASGIFAEAFGKDPAFFAFYRTLQAYQHTLNAKDTTIILSPDSTFLREFSKPELR